MISFLNKYIIDGLTVQPSALELYGGAVNFKKKLALKT